MTDWRLAAAGVRDFNVPRRTPRHPTKSHVVVAKVGSRVKLIRFGQQGVEGAGRPSARDDARARARRRSFKRRHAANIARGPLSPAWWADRVKW